MATKNTAERYSMHLERSLIDKLGLKLYDKVSAVVAELISNSYDADAEKVSVSLPLGKALATRKDDVVEQAGYTIEVRDDGHGMDPSEANEFYLRVGKDRRLDSKRGGASRGKNRPVMGRKGIGKLAPFGVCKTIEIRSAGGTETAEGYRVTHFELDYDEILAQTSDSDYTYHPRALADDGTFEKKSGTLVRLKNFLPRRVPDRETFARQLAEKFLPLPDFEVTAHDTKTESPEPLFQIGGYDVPIMDGTRISIDARPVELTSEKSLPVRGWIALAKHSYKNVEFSGVRIYARGKFVALTKDFGVPSGFPGEFVLRSYLVGEIVADWLDDEEDLIQTHRQDILWSTDVGQAFSSWGQKLLKEVARAGREPHRKKVKGLFMEASELAKHAKERFSDPELQRTAIELGEVIGSFASEEELGDEEYLGGLREIILNIAPHKLLVDAFKEIEKLSVGGKVDLKELMRLFDTAKIAQLSSYGQIVAEKLRVIDVFETAIRQEGTEEKDVQKIIEQAPWLVDASWEHLISNRPLEDFRSAFVAWYQKQNGEELVTSAIANPTRKPDFVFLHQDNSLKVVEIKSPGHKFDNEDWKRLNRYDDALEKFFEENPKFKKDFPEGFNIVLVTDGVNLTDSSNKKAFDSLKDKGRILPKTWEELLRDVKRHNKDFLTQRDASAKGGSS